MKILLVGEAPSRDSDLRHLEMTLALKSICRKRTPSLSQDLSLLEEASGRLTAFFHETTHVNLLQEWPGPGPRGRGADFPMDVAREKAAKLSRLLVMAKMGHSPTFGGTTFSLHPSVILLAGLRVTRAFRLYGKTSPGYFRCLTELNGTPVYAVPHPSGVNRWWNDPDNVVFARTFLERLGEEARARHLAKS